MLKAGIIGLGVGEAHISGYESHSNCKVVAVCDFLNEVQYKFSSLYPHLKFTKNAAEILNDPEIDVISIASYDNYHFDQIIQALNNNKHVFVEKPLCLYEQEAIAIKNKLSEKKKLKLSCNFILRKTPRFIYIKELIKKGDLGHIYYLEGDYNYGRINKITEGWRGQLDYYAVTYGGGIHLIDLILWLTNDTVDEVFTYGNNISTRGSSFKFNDLTASLLKFKSGVVAKITTNFGSVFPHFHVLNIYGTNATFMNGLKEAHLYKTRETSSPPEIINHAYPGTKKGDLIHDFVESITNSNHHPIIKQAEIFNVMAVCFATEKSMNENRPVKVNYF